MLGIRPAFVPLHLIAHLALPAVALALRVERASQPRIRHCADLVRGTFRTDDFIVRIGGEEFIVLLPGKNVNYAYRLAEKFRRAMDDESMTETSANSSARCKSV